MKILSLGVGVFLSAFSALAARGAAQSGGRLVAHVATESLPVVVEADFVENHGQWDARILYRLRCGDLSVFVERQRLTLVLAKVGGEQFSLRWSFAGAAGPGDVEPESPGAGRHNFFVGADRERWRTDVPAYRAVVYREIYPGVDLRLKQHRGSFKYDVVVRPGARLQDVVIRVAGARPTLGVDGALVMATPLGAITQPPPITFEGNRPVACRYRLVDGESYGFDVDGWTQTEDLLIDPVLLYGSYVGGLGSDTVWAVAQVGDEIVAYGETTSPDFPTTPGALQSRIMSRYDVFVTKLDVGRSGAAALTYATYLGGSDAEAADYGQMQVDASGALITIVGSTRSFNFPTAANAYDRSHNGREDMFVTRIDPRAIGQQQLVYSTFLGSAGSDIPWAMAVDPQGRVGVTGQVNGGTFPLTSGAFMRSGPSCCDAACIACIDPSLPPTAQLCYGTYFGGRFGAIGQAIAFGPNGLIAVAGRTGSDDLPLTPGAFQATNDRFQDAFLAIFDPGRVGAAQLRYSTYFGGFDEEDVEVLAWDDKGVLVLGGNTKSADLPTTPRAYSRSLSGVQSCFVARLDPSRVGAAQLRYSTYLGGPEGYNALTAMAIEPGGIVTLAGFPGNKDFPVTEGAYQIEFRGHNSFVTQLDLERSRILYSTFLGGTSTDFVFDLRLDPAGNATVGGVTVSVDFPTTVNAYRRTAYGFEDGFVARLDLLLRGLERFGRASRGCAGAPRLRGTGLPRIGAAGFELLSTEAPPTSPGLVLFGSTVLSSPIVLGGVELFVDPASSVLVPMQSSSRGRGDLPVPIPRDGGLVGAALYTQAVWLGPSASPCPPSGLSASMGLRIVIQQ
jgi:hypothetical protein